MSRAPRTYRDDVTACESAADVYERPGDTCADTGFSVDPPDLTKLDGRPVLAARGTKRKHEQKNWLENSKIV